MELELKHITPYLPYRLKGVVNGWVLLVSGIDKPYTLSEVIIKFLNEKSDEPIQNFKPILRPLSDLTKEIEVNGEKFVPIRKLKTGGTNIENVYTVEDWDGINYVCCDNESHELRFSAKSGFDRRYNCESRQIYAYDLFQMLFEWHFDVFGLIEQGLAIDINTLND